MGALELDMWLVGVARGAVADTAAAGTQGSVRAGLRGAACCEERAGIRCLLALILLVFW